MTAAIRAVASMEDVQIARDLFREYAASLGFSLCFQDFAAELERITEIYSPPEGALLLAFEEGAPAGCVGLKRLPDGGCELKRLYVRPSARGRGIGRKLAAEIMKQAVSSGFRIMRLDTIEETMREAVALYRSLGFYEIAPYYDNPVPGALFMECDLMTPIAGIEG